MQCSSALFSSETAESVPQIPILTGLITAANQAATAANNAAVDANSKAAAASAAAGDADSAAARANAAAALIEGGIDGFVWKIDGVSYLVKFRTTNGQPQVEYIIVN